MLRIILPAVLSSLEDFLAKFIEGKRGSRFHKIAEKVFADEVEEKMGAIVALYGKAKDKWEELSDEG